MNASIAPGYLRGLALRIGPIMAMESCWLTYSKIELGTACGKLFRCSVMSILDAGTYPSHLMTFACFTNSLGDSDILSTNTEN